MSDSLTKEKHQLIRTIAQDEGIIDYNLEVKSGSNKGDGYMGIISTIHIQAANLPDKELHLVLKSAMSSDKFRDQTPVRKAYEREIYLYETVFPILNHFSDRSGITHKFTELAKCYGSLFTEKEECIVFEDLRHSGFKMWNRKTPMNREHLQMVFATYGKFHGTGLALKLLEPEKFEVLQDNLKNIFRSNMEDKEERSKMETSLGKAFKSGFDAVGDNEKAIEALTRFSKELHTFFFEAFRKIDQFSTILHGDCWINNMMFKYENLEDSLNPTDMRLLDWQLAMVGSPILDLSSFFYGASSREELYNLQQYLKIYYDNLSRTVEDVGMNVWSFEELEKQWKIYSRFGLFRMFLVLKIMFTEVEEAPDFSESAEEGRNLMESMLQAPTNNIKEIHQRIDDVVNFMIQNEYL